MDKQHKAAKVISGLVLLASILLLIDYYLPLQHRLLVVSSNEAQSEKVAGSRGYVSTNRYGYWYADGIKISSNNFKRINLAPGDTIVLTRSVIYKLQTKLTATSGYYAGYTCDADYNPFGLRGLFILLPLLLAIVALRSHDKAASVVGGGVATAVYLADICSLFIL